VQNLPEVKGWEWVRRIGAGGGNFQVGVRKMAAPNITLWSQWYPLQIGTARLNDIIRELASDTYNYDQVYKNLDLFKPA